jgi:hypothetical protein
MNNEHTQEPKPYKVQTAFLTVFSFVLFLISPLIAEATSGGPGPILKEAFFSSGDIYILSEFNDGRGYSAQLQKISQNSQTTTLYSWEDTLEMDHSNDGEISTYIESLIPADAIALQEVDLQKRNFSVEYSVMLEAADLKKTESNTFNPNYTTWRLKGDIAVNDESKTEFFIDHCITYQNGINVRGYGLPGQEFLLFVVTYIGKCHEYGYIAESFHLSQGYQIPVDAFLVASHNPVIPAGLPESEYCCPLGTKVFASPSGFYTSDNLPIPKMINNAGFEMYLAESYEMAKQYFSIAITLSENIDGYPNREPYHMPRFNLAAVQSKTGDYDSALQNVRILFRSRDPKYINKIFTDADFEPIIVELTLLFLKDRFLFYVKPFFQPQML